MSIKRYTIGFIACLLLTAASFAIVQEHYATGHQFPSHPEVFAGLFVLAVAQLVVQLVFFLHIGRESRQRDMVALVFGATLICIIVGGSLWIMANLMHSGDVPYDQGSITPQGEQD